jgi:hypothetical protein
MVSRNIILASARLAAALVTCAAIASQLETVQVGAQQAQPANQVLNRSTLRIELAPYDDSPDSLRQLSTIIRVLPPRRANLPPNGTISALVLAEYGFGPSNLPSTYALLQERILALNGLNTPEQAVAGEILVPSLPSNVRYNPAIAWNSFPSVADFRVMPRSGGVDMTAARVEDVVVERVTDTRRLGANGITFDLPLPANLLRDESIAALVKEAFASLPSEPLRVKFESQECSNPNPGPVLSQQQRVELETLLKGAKRTVPLYIVDTGWPSAVAQKESWEHLRSLLQKVRQHFRLGASPTLPLPAFAEPSVDHCKRIDRALDEFRSVNRTQVRVVYVPMSKEQGAAPLLREMVEVADTVRRIVSRFRRDQLPATVPPDIVNNAKKFASDVIPRVPDTITGEITETDKAVLESTIILAAEAARLDGTFHIVNESWVVATDVVRYDQPSNPMGLIIAAAGNDGVNINLKEVDFAHRSSTGGSFLAVMNVDDNGDPTCASSSIDLSVLDTSSAIGFSGAIAGRSATSYAAPRVGWLLAAAEAVRPQPIEPGLWPGQIQARIKRTRTTISPPSLRVLRGDPVKLVRLWLD